VLPAGKPVTLKAGIRSMKTLIITLFVSFVGVAMAGDVQAFPVKGIDLAAYKTFKMLPPRVLTKAGIQENDPTYGPYILASVRKELTAKGLKEVQENPDIEVATGGLGRAFPQLEALIYSYTVDADWGTGTLTTVGRYNKEGTVLVNCIDPKTKKTVWFGMASRAWGKPSSADSMIAKATAQLFKKYPPLP
jgi:hypothetical protein